MSFPTILRGRELGLSRALTQGKIQKALDKRIADNLAEDCFQSQTIELPHNADYNIFRCQNLVAVLKVSESTNSQKVQSLALFSLITHCKLWDLEITENYKGSYQDTCQLSEDGMVVMNDSSTKSNIIVFDGKKVGVLENLNWLWIQVSGMHILGCSREVLSLTDPAACSDSVNDYFGEYDQQGKRLTRYLLDNTKERKIFILDSEREKKYAFNENFWVRFSTSYDRKVPAIIEVVDRVIGKMKTFELPLSEDEEYFSPPYIVQNRLIYGKSVLHTVDTYGTKIGYNPTIYIFDLIKGLIVEKFPMYLEHGLIETLVANEHYIAWMESNGFNNQIKYLDISIKNIKKSTPIPYRASSQVSLSIVGKVLSIVYLIGYAPIDSIDWYKRVVDMTNGKINREVKYGSIKGSKCSIANGNLLITVKGSRSYKMYIESFTSEEN